MATKVCLVCGRDRDEKKYEKAAGKVVRKNVCVSCIEAMKTSKAPSP